MNRRRISDTKRAAIFLAAGGLCHICGGKIAGKWELEHVIPLALSGADDESNMRPVHPACHAGKTAADNARWSKAKRQQIKHIGAHRSARPMDGSKASRFKKRMDGTVEIRR